MSGQHRDRACALIVALRDGPKSTDCLAEWLGLEASKSARQTVREWLRSMESAGLVRRTERPPKAFAVGRRAAVYEWVSE